MLGMGIGNLTPVPGDDSTMPLQMARLPLVGLAMCQIRVDYLLIIRVNSAILIYGGPSITQEIMVGFWNFFF